MICVKVICAYSVKPVWALKYSSWNNSA